MTISSAMLSMSTRIYSVVLTPGKGLQCERLRIALINAHFLIIPPAFLFPPNSPMKYAILRMHQQDPR